MNKNIPVFLMLLFLCFTPAIWAQEVKPEVMPEIQQPQDKSNNNNRTFGLYFSAPIEYLMVDHTGMNDELRNSSYPELVYPKVNVGFGIQFFIGNIIATYNYINSTTTTSKNSYALDVSYKSKAYTIGYDFIKQPKYSLYPFVGYTQNDVSYTYLEKSSDEIELGDYLKTELDYKKLTHRGYNLDLGIGFSIQKSLLLGFRAGVLVPLGADNWKINSTDDVVDGTPKHSNSYYFSLSIGIGSISKFKNRKRIKPQGIAI